MAKFRANDPVRIVRAFGHNGKEGVVTAVQDRDPFTRYRVFFEVGEFYTFMEHELESLDSVPRIITFDEIQKGDKIRVTLPAKGVVMIGVAEKFRMYSKQWWATAADFILVVDTKDGDGIIELLERPEPKPELPTEVGSIINYPRMSGRRKATAILMADGNWMEITDGGRTEKYFVETAEEIASHRKWTLVREGFGDE